MAKPDLQFLHSSDRVGFTPAEVTSFGESAPSGIVRELIQNAFDASQVAHNRTAVIRFRLGTVSLNDIPGIDSYRAALSKAKSFRKSESDGELTSQEQMVVERMEGALRKSELPILTVIDNGAGLICKTMGALLGNGISAKPGESGGAYGNGHYTAFPISDLRYLLYAAVNDSGWIASGHTILASQSGCSANGYYISSATDEGKHCYPTEESDIPKVIMKTLKDIKKNYGHGTAVFIPAFNNFRRNTVNLYDAIAEAATCSFFPAIEDEKLVVILEKENARSKIQKIDKSNLRKTLCAFEGNKQNRNFLSGYKANLAHRAMEMGDQYVASILGGEVDIYLQTPSPDGRPHVNLFRNGMWIANSDRSSGGLPGFYNVFGGHQSFEAVILVTAENAPEFHGLIRKAETPLHNQLNLESMPEKDQKTLKEGFKSLREWLKEIVPEISKDGYRPPHLLGVVAESNALGRSSMAGWKYQGAVTVMTKSSRATGHTRKEAAGEYPRSGRSRKTGKQKIKDARKALRGTFRVTARPISGNNGKSEKKICIHSCQDCSDVILRLVVDENTDSTTDDHVWRQYEAEIVSAKRVTPGESSNKVMKIIRRPHSAVRIGDLGAGESITVDVSYKIAGIEGASLSDPSLRVRLERAGDDAGSDR